MIDVDEGVNQIPIIPQEEDISITFGFYYSDLKANSGSRIVKDQFKSNKFRTFIVSRTKCPFLLLTESVAVEQTTGCARRNARLHDHPRK